MSKLIYLLLVVSVFVLIIFGIGALALYIFQSPFIIGLVIILLIYFLVRGATQREHYYDDDVPY